MRPNVLIQRLPSLVALVAIGATGCADERKGPATGSLEGACYPNGTCDNGLHCEGAGDAAVCQSGPADGAAGGACFANGTCNAGLICNGDTCEADDTIPVGTLGGACYGNGTCNTNDLMCVGSVCEVRAANTGASGGECYPNGSCNAGLVCESNKCETDDSITPGTDGGACLVNGTCWSGLICNGSTCEPDTTLTVGTENAACFPNGTCNAGLECALEDALATCHIAVPVVVGIEDGPCYDNGTCNGGLVCDLGTCVPGGTPISADPGAEGGLCYQNGTCDDGLVCNSFGKCEPIVDGALGGDCIQGSGCGLGLSCYSGTCLPTVEHLGSIHGVVTDAATNARLEGVNVQLIHLGGAENTETDALGYYDFDDLLPGHFEVTFEPTDGDHTVRRIRDITVECPLFQFDDDDALSLQDQECNQVHDIELFPFTATESGTIWYQLDEEVVPAEGVTVTADFSVEGEGADDVDISPDRFSTTTGADGSFTLSDLPNTGERGVYVFISVSQFNGVDFESGWYWADLDIFDGDAVEIFLTPDDNPPFIVANNFEDYLNGGFDIASPIELTFSRAMKPEGCHITLSREDDENSTPVLGEVVWSEGNTKVTFTPFQALDTDSTYHVGVSGCESALDDQAFVQPCVSGDNTEDNCFDFTTIEGIDFVISNADLDDDGPDQPGDFVASDDITLTFDQNVDLTVAGGFVNLFRLVSEYPGNHNPDASDALPVASTSSASANVVSVDPAADLVADAFYAVDFKVYSTIAGDFDEGTVYFHVQPEGTLEFLTADVPVVGPGQLMALDPSASITLTFSKDVNLALSTVTLENDDANQTNTGFVVDATITADGNTITIDPTEDLDRDQHYTVRYNVAAQDQQGVAAGTFSFDVADEDVSIAFVDSNLEPIDGVNWDRNIRLDFSSPVAADPRNVIVLVDEFGNEFYPSFGAGSDSDPDDDINNDGMRLEFDGDLAPDRDYTLTYRIYADVNDTDPTSELGTWVQGSITFTTAGHITLASTTVGEYEDSNNDGFFDGDDYSGAGIPDPDVNGFDPAGVISVTFTEAPDLAVYHAINFVGLWRVFGGATGDELVATTNTVDGNTVTLTPFTTLDTDGAQYCVRYWVTSALTRIPNDADPGEAFEDVSEQANLCFRTTAPAAIDPVRPSTAPGAFGIQANFVVDHDTTIVPLTWNRPTNVGVQGTNGDPLYYEVYARDEDNQDFLLVGTQTDNPDATLQTFSWDVCNGPADPILCENPSDPFSETNTAFLRVRACNDDGCGPFTPATGAGLAVEDKLAPVIDADNNDIWQDGSANNTGGTEDLEFSIFVRLNERSDAGTIGFTLANKKDELTCAPRTTPAEDYNANGWELPEETIVVYDCVCELGDNPATVPVETNFAVDCSTEDGEPPAIDPDGAGPLVGGGDIVRLTVSAKDDNGNQSAPENYDLDDNVP